MSNLDVGETGLNLFFAKITTTDPRRACKRRFNLKGAWVPGRNELLAGTLMQVLEPTVNVYQVSTSCIRFSGYLVDYVSMYLAMGIRPEKPAMLVYADRCSKPYHEIIACYVDLKFPVLLWRESSKPDWVW